ncbi:hypothetical protein [Nitrosovibrio sp. Nv4]|nr:hypothetical protein [Nitrosovibrio sp. Nv4]SOD41943.1 hypothetical protein SAMN06298226_2261 [Nitrosovibrio sp. Nv4]
MTGKAHRVAAGVACDSRKRDTGEIFADQAVKKLALHILGDRKA